jgi:hypothetical protein
MGTENCFPPGPNGQDMKLPTHIHHCQGWECEVLDLHSPYIFMAWYLIKHEEKFAFYHKTVSEFNESICIRTYKEICVWIFCDTEYVRISSFSYWKFRSVVICVYEQNCQEAKCLMWDGSSMIPCNKHQLSKQRESQYFMEPQSEKLATCNIH